MRGNYSWKSACSESYRELNEKSGWIKCTECGEYPRTLVWDNGNQAKCRCYHKFDTGVCAMSILEATDLKIPYEDYTQMLKDAWNKRVLELKFDDAGGSNE